MSFNVGQRVCCVDDSLRNYGTWFGIGDLTGLKKGQIYTIRMVGIYRGFPSLWLNEIVRDAFPAEFGEAGYSARRFRPVVERKTSIAIFQRIRDDITNKQPVKV